MSPSDLAYALLALFGFALVADIVFKRKQKKKGGKMAAFRAG